MKIGVIGATGKAGQKIVVEAQTRGHEVTAIVRNASKVTEDVQIIEKDIFDVTTADIENFEVVVSAFGTAAGEEHLFIETGAHLIKIFGDIDTRLIIVGGAGSLFVDEEKTTRLYDTADFPALFYPTASSQGQNLISLQASDINWTFISPAINFDAEGKRTGSYTKGRDHVIVNRTGESYISYADYAIAVVDEAEQAAHRNERFTVVAEKEQ